MSATAPTSAIRAARSNRQAVGVLARGSQRPRRLSAGTAASRGSGARCSAGAQEAVVNLQDDGNLAAVVELGEGLVA